MNYKDVLRATDEGWQKDARKLVEKAIRFVVIDLDQQGYRDCIALAQEFDYACLVEEQGEPREIVLANFPDVLPKKLGLVPRNTVTRKPPTKSQ